MWRCGSEGTYVWGGEGMRGGRWGRWGMRMRMRWNETRRMRRLRRRGRRECDGTMEKVWRGGEEESGGKDGQALAAERISYVQHRWPVSPSPSLSTVNA